MTTTTREKFEEQFCFKQTDDWVTHYPSLRTNIDQTESIWSFIETIEKEAEERWKQKLATYIKENKEPDTSILEKLREKLERKVQQTIEQIEKTQQIRDCERLNVLREIQYLLTSLEQPQTKVDTEAKVWQVIAENIK